MKQFYFAGFFIFVASLLSSGCQPTDTIRSSSSIISGRNSIELIQWEDIPAAEQKISIIDEKGAILARRQKKDARRNILSQAMKLRNGSILFERREDLPEEAVLTPKEEFLNRYEDHPELKARHLKIQEKNIKKKANKEGDIYYSVAESEQKKCLIFFQYAADSVFETKSEKDKPHYEAVTGSACADPGTSSAETLEEDVLDLVARVKFDDGEYAREQLLKAAFSKLDEQMKKLDRLAKEDVDGPELDLASSLKVTGEEVSIAGSVRDGSGVDMVLVDEYWADVDSNGNFSRIVPVPPNRDYFSVVAMDRFGNRSEKKIKIAWQGGAGRKRRSVEQKDLGQGSFYALLIGNNNYLHWRDLVTPMFDVQAISELLRNGYGFQGREIVTDGSQKELLQVLDELRTKLTENDSLLIYYSGHGVLYKGRGYWVPVDGKVEDPEKWIPNAEISRAIRRIPARHVLVVADSCYSGTLTQSFVAARPNETSYLRRSRTAMSAGSGDQVVLEPVLAEGEKDYSVFAKRFMMALESNARKVTTASNVYAEVKNLFKFFPQNPQYGTVGRSGHQEGGDFFFLKKEMNVF